MTETPPIDPTQLTDAELNAAIIAASQKVIAARRTRDQAKIDAAYAEYRVLVEERDRRAAA